MILGGDEFARSQHGNNNAYCQDNEISWFDWTAAATQRGSDRVLPEGDRADAPLSRPPAPEVLPRQGPGRRRRAGPDVVRAGPARPPLEGCRRADDLLSARRPRGAAPTYDADRLFFIFNGHFESAVGHAAAARTPTDGWYRAIDTSLPSGEDFAEPRKEIALDPADHYIVNPRSTVVLLAR